jgi:hypothetical protein
VHHFLAVWVADLVLWVADLVLWVADLVLWVAYFGVVGGGFW